MKSPIMLIGDTILDVYHYGQKLGISAETPTLVAKEEKKTVSFGGAALVLRNILALNGEVIFISALGNDDFGKFEKNLTHKNLKKLWIRERGVKTTVKERFWVQNHKLLQWDHLNENSLNSAGLAKLLSYLKSNIGGAKKIIISDYRHGLLTKKVAEKILTLAQKNKVPVYIDSQISQNASNHLWYRGADLFCLNTKEAESISPEFNPKKMRASLAKLKSILGAKKVVVKLGEQGSAALLGNNFVMTPAYKVNAVDTTGAGDSFLAMLAVSSLDIGKRELKMANAWAALSTTIKGAEPPGISEFLKIMPEPKFL